MTIQVTKEPINLREKLNELETNKGLKGNEILQAETAQEVRSLIGAGRKNLIINGGFDVWQRGTSSSSKGNYTADRWKHHFYSSGSITTSKQASGLVDFPNCVRVQRPVGTTAIQDLHLNYAMESQECSRLVGKTLTLSYWMRKGSDFAGNTMRAVLMFGTGVDDYINYDYFATHRVSAHTLGGIRRYSTPTTNWERITETYQVHADTTQIGVAFSSDYDSTSGTAGANDYIDITGVQLELGSVATDFEHRSYGEELALCQRYYEAGSWPNYFRMMDTSDGYTQHVTYFKTTKRATPTITTTWSSNPTNPMNVHSIDGFTSLDTNGGNHYMTSYTADAEL